MLNMMRNMYTHSDLFKPLPKERFDIIYADPPWHYYGGSQFNPRVKKTDTGGALTHYSTMLVEDLMKLAVSEIMNENCLLFMWAASPHLDKAIYLGTEWGFQYRTVAFVWHKQRPNPGFYTMSENELCLVFKKGIIPNPRGERNVRQTVEWKRGEHSEKPEEVRKRIEKMFPEQSKIELFARKAVDGWTVWGNEV